MGLYDRDYTREGFRSQYGDVPPTRMGLPRVTPVVKWLLIINIVVFVVCFLIRPVRNLLFAWFSVYPVDLARCLQLWRLVTYQFLHSVNGFGHIFANMLVLYFFGPMLERHWGSKKFAIFYLACGAVGGVLYPLLACAGWLDVGPLIGASGAIFGLLAAGAILFPNLTVYLMFIFPVPLMVVAIILAAISAMTLFSGVNAGGEAAHLAGMAAGAAYVLSQGRVGKLKVKLQSGTQEKQVAARQNLQIEVDRILQKVHDHGINSLTSREKKTLKQATKTQQMRNSY